MRLILRASSPTMKRRKCWSMSQAAGRDAQHAAGGFDLDDNRSKHADAPARAFFAVLGIARHRVGDQAVDQPMALVLLEVVARALAVDEINPEVGDGEFRGHGGLPIQS